MCIGKFGRLSNPVELPLELCTGIWTIDELLGDLSGDLRR